MKNPKLLFFIIIVFIFSINIKTSGTSELQDGNITELKNLIKRYRKKFNLPSISVAVIKKNDLSLSASTGIKKLGEKERVNLKNRYHIGSCTKSFTAFLIGKLVELKKIKWSSTVLGIFPELKGIIHQDLKNITVRNLLSHRAGIAPYSDNIRFPFKSKKNLTIIERRKEFALWLLKQKPFNTPGDFIYSNAGYGIIAAIIEKVTGLSWEENLKKYIFDPLNLKTAGFGWPLSSNSKEPWGHWDRFKITPHSPDDDWKICKLNAPAGDIHMSIIDFAKYVQIHIKGLAGENSLLKSNTIQEIHKPIGKYGFGWNILPFMGDNISIHNGSAGTFFSSVAINHRSNIGIIVLTNVGGNNANKATKEITKELLKLLLN